MKFIPLLRTRRLTVQLKELSIGAAIALANIPEHLEETACTAFLNSTIASVQTGSENPSDWTVQERTLAVAHYLASILTDGPDFSLGAGSYSDYLDGTADISLAMNQLPVGEVGGDNWEIQHLTGARSESIERLQGEFESLSPRLYWVIGAMAAQLVRTGEVVPDLSTDGLYDEWLLSRIRVFLEFPESDFEQLMAVYGAGREKLHHLFAFTFDDRGIAILPKVGGTEGLPSARFPVRTTLSRMALNMAGKPN
jgi:hypothetical protein